MAKINGLDKLEKFVSDLKRLSNAKIQMQDGKVKGTGVGASANIMTEKVSETAEDADFEGRYQHSRLEGEGRIEISEDEIKKLARRQVMDVLDKFLR